MVPGLRDIVNELAMAGYSRPTVHQFESDAGLARLTAVGSELWLDTGDREKARSVWKRELTALTTNNTLANQVVQSGVMDNDIRETASHIRANACNMSDDDLIREIGFVVNCKIALRLVEAFNVNVSVELHPDWARSKEKTVEMGRRYFKVCPERFIVKVPLTPEGYLAVAELSKEGIPVNFTLGFSARQNYLAARLSNPKWTNVFLGRLNAVVKDNGIGSGEYVGEKVMMSTQRVLRALREANDAIETHLIGASIRSGAQLLNIAGSDVLTIPPAAIEDFYRMNVKPEEIQDRVDHPYEVSVEAHYQDRMEQLWDVDEDFRTFVDHLLAMKLGAMSGDDVVSVCEKHEINLFHRFTDSELSKIQSDGKIPKLADWDTTIGIDDLMTQSALQSFTQDQQALDDYIRRMIQQ